MGFMSAIASVTKGNLIGQITGAAHIAGGGTGLVGVGVGNIIGSITGGQQRAIISLMAKPMASIGTGAIIGAITNARERARISTRPKISDIASAIFEPAGIGSNAAEAVLTGDAIRYQTDSEERENISRSGGFHDSAEEMQRAGYTHSIEQAKTKSRNSGSTMMNKFVSNLNWAGGLAVQNRYQVLIPTTSLGDNSTKIYNLIQANSTGRYSANSRNITFDWMWDFYGGEMPLTAVELTAFCDKTQIPSYQFQMETVRHYGPSFKIPHMPEYQDITMSFLCSGGMWERYFFDAWMYMIMDPITNNFNYKNEYAVDVVIASYIPGGDIVDNDRNYITQLIDCFPVSVQEQELGYDMNNSIQRVQVSFSYKYATPFGSAGMARAGMDRRGTPTPFKQTIATEPTIGFGTKIQQPNPPK